MAQHAAPAPPRQSGIAGNVLKLIAIVAMTIDHLHRHLRAGVNIPADLPAYHQALTAPIMFFNRHTQGHAGGRNYCILHRLL